tara:strand:+ start:28 stop:579 length:552 start_codon:yes stop_codon:yes gene_type:complete
MRKKIKITLFIALVAINYIYIFKICDQNQELKTMTIDYKNQIEDFYHKVDSLEREMDTLVYNNEMSKFNITQQDVLDAIMFIESGNDDSAYAASEDAVGCLQIRRVMVDDVNRILKRQESPVRFTYEDRWDRKKSIEIFNIFCTYYNLDTPEDMARGWNGGPRGMDKSSTMYYWTKVEAELNS